MNVVCPGFDFPKVGGYDTYAHAEHLALRTYVVYVQQGFI